MHQEKYNLSWDSYSDHLKGMLHNMMKSEYLTDVTVVCDDKKKLDLDCNNVKPRLDNENGWISMRNDF